MRPCSYWAYIDAEQRPVRVRVEATCPLLTPENRILEPKGGSITYSASLARLFLPVTPCRSRLLPLPLPRHRVVDVSILVDAEPGIELHGAPERRVAVVAYTQRTLLEGKGYLQLAEAEPLHGDLYVPRGAAPGEMGPPLTHPGLEELTICETLRGLGLNAWGSCVEDLAVPGSLDELLVLARREPGCSSRAYAGLAARSGIEPSRLEGIPEPLVAEAGREGVKIRAIVPGLRVLLRRHSGSATIVLEENVKGETIVPGEWEEIAVECRRCWTPLRQREP